MSTDKLFMCEKAGAYEGCEGCGHATPHRPFISQDNLPPMAKVWCNEIRTYCGENRELVRCLPTEG